MVRIVLSNFILIVTVISIRGIPTSSFLALFASAGVAIGMALGGTLRTLRAASHTPRPYRIGGNFVIEAQGYSGTVKEDHRYSTHHHHHRRQQDHHHHDQLGGLPTGSINSTGAMHSTRRISWDIGISYGEPARRRRPPRTILAMLSIRIHRVVKAEEIRHLNPRIVAGAAPRPTYRRPRCSWSSLCRPGCDTSGQRGPPPPDGWEAPTLPQRSSTKAFLPTSASRPASISPSPASMFISTHQPLLHHAASPISSAAPEPQCRGIALSATASAARRLSRSGPWC